MLSSLSRALKGTLATGLSGKDIEGMNDNVDKLRLLLEMCTRDGWDHKQVYIYCVVS